MKKVFFVLAMAALLLVSGLGITACDDDSDNSSPYQKTDTEKALGTWRKSITVGGQNEYNGTPLMGLFQFMSNSTWSQYSTLTPITSSLPENNGTSYIFDSGTANLLLPNSGSSAITFTYTFLTDTQLSITITSGMVPADSAIFNGVYTKW